MQKGTKEGKMGQGGRKGWRPSLVSWAGRPLLCRRDGMCALCLWRTLIVPSDFQKLLTL